MIRLQSLCLIPCYKILPWTPLFKFMAGLSKIATGLASKATQEAKQVLAAAGAGRVGGREGVHCAGVLVCCRRGEIQHWRHTHLHVADERDQRPPMAHLSRSFRAGGTRWTQKKSSSTSCAQATCPPTGRCSSWSATCTTTSCLLNLGVRAALLVAP